MALIVQFTNEYARMHIPHHPYCGSKRGAWMETTTQEMYRLFAIIIYMSLVNMPEVDDYWKTTAPFHGLWARAIIPSRRRYYSLMKFLHLNMIAAAGNERLIKVQPIYDHMKNKCCKLFQPFSASALTSAC